MDILIFAVIAGILFYKLYNVLGAVDGETSSLKQSNSTIIDIVPDKEKIVEQVNENFQSESDKIRIFDPKFTEDNFLKGASKAYEMILNAFSKSEYEILKLLSNEEIYLIFTQEIEKYKKDNKKFERVIIALPVIEITKINIINDIAYIDVKYVSEQMLVEKNLIDETPITSRTVKITDNWRFEKNLSQNKVNWILVKI